MEHVAGRLPAGQHGIEHAPHPRLAQAGDERVDEEHDKRFVAARREIPQVAQNEGARRIDAADVVRRAAEVGQIAVDRGVQGIEDGLEGLGWVGLLAGDLDVDPDGGRPPSPSRCSTSQRALVVLPVCRPAWSVKYLRSSIRSSTKPRRRSGGSM